MNYEKQNGVPKRRPLPCIGAQSPKVVGRGTTPRNVGNPSMTNGYNTGGRERQLDGGEDGDGCLDEDVAMPVKTFLSSNITPRSNSRKARAETASPTCNGTPTGTYVASKPTSSNGDSAGTRTARASSGLGLRISDSGRRSKTGSITSDGPDSSAPFEADPVQWVGPTSRLSSPENAPKFFHANDIKPNKTRPLSERSAPQSYLPDYVQSKGQPIPNGRSLISGRSPTPDEQKAKFFYSNNPDESKSPSLKLTNGNNLSRPQLQTIYSANTAGSPPRASSPLKEEMLPRKTSLSKPSPRRHTRLVSNGGSELKSPETIPIGQVDLSRRSSLKSPRPSGHSTHRRSPSVPTAQQSLSRRPSISLSDVNPVKRTRTTSLTGPHGTLPHSVNPPSITDELPKSPPPSQPPSPTKQSAIGQSKIDQMNELAAKARRERKVLDLEISNSSLLAINRTLEREMRKVNAELRRFRRLSRSGRISIAPSSRSASGKMSMLSETDINANADDLISSSDDEGEITNIPSDMSSTSASSGPSSPNARAARARFQDPKIELDLAGHRDLLLDSQKLNISIKRCLAHSESLISAGRKALEYRAHIPEQAKQGARVLTPDEIKDDCIGQGQGLLSPSIDQTGLNPWERSLESIGSLDSGLETPDYSKWGPPTSVPTPFADTTESSYQSGDLDGHLKFLNELSHDSHNKLDEVFPARAGVNVIGSEIASIDGIDEDNNMSSEVEADNDLHNKVENNDARLSPAEVVGRISRTTSPERNEKMRSTDPQPGQPGYRGSMQGLGHYLQAFSIFGASQHT